MPDYVLLMHDDADDDSAAWEPYLRRLGQSACFEGGSAMGDGVCARKSGTAPPVTGHLTGYIRIKADSLDHAKAMLAGNPVFEAGGTVEIRELPRSAGVETAVRSATVAGNTGGGAPVEGASSSSL